MKKVLWTLSAALLSMNLELSGHEFKHCYVQDPAKHSYNKSLLHAVVAAELALLDPAMPPDKKACSLFSRISQIAIKLMWKGFFIDAYAIPIADDNATVSFSCFALWEGDHDSQIEIPLTFFVYVWPAEDLILRQQNMNAAQSHRSNIHSHPIPCAFAVLHGRLVQNNYELVDWKNRKVNFTSSEIFEVETSSVDDLFKHSIHQLYAKDRPCFSLHAYGLGTSEKVMKSFRKTMPLHSYDELSR